MVDRKNKLAREAGLPATSKLSFKSKKDLKHTISIREQNIADGLRVFNRGLQKQAFTTHIPPSVVQQHWEINPGCFHLPKPTPTPTQLAPGRTAVPMFHEARRKNNCWPNPEGKVDMDCKLTYRRKTHEWTFVWVYGKPVAETSVWSPENQGVRSSPISIPTPSVASSSAHPPLPGLRACAIDLGIMPFIAWYSPSEGYGTIGGDYRERRGQHLLGPNRTGNPNNQPLRNDADRIFRLALFIDHLQSRTTEAPARRRNSFRQAQARARRKLKRLVTEVHRKAIRFLMDRFDVVIVPRLDVTMMSRSAQRKIRSPTVRRMLTWSHGLFVDRLKSKAEEEGKWVKDDMSEAYTRWVR